MVHCSKFVVIFQKFSSFFIGSKARVDLPQAISLHWIYFRNPGQPKGQMIRRNPAEGPKCRRLSRGRNPAEIAFMSTSTGPTGHHPLAFVNDVLN